jgi:hypothetical protein
MIRTPQTPSFLTRISTKRALTCVASLSLAAALAFPMPTSQADVIRSGGAVTVTPGGRTVESGLRTAVVSVTDTSGNVDTAQSAMLAANVALARVPGFTAVPAKDVAAAFGKIGLRDKLDAKDFQEIGKKTKAARVLTLTITPGDTTDGSALYSAIAELYDTSNGSLVGRGDGIFTATADAIAADTNAQQPAAPATATGAMSQALPNRALGGAVYQAINELNRPATFNGVVISIAGPYQARLSLGERHGVRNGARVEYLQNGEPFAYGTVFDLGRGESVASIAPEAAASLVGVNTQVRTVSNPAIDRAGKTAEQVSQAEFKTFERNFGISAAIAGVVYYAFIR